jgi:delta 1-pyrroline-5-carboxylate dehydrogenase
MKNILIIETHRSDQGANSSFVKDIDDIKDLEIKQAIVDAINGVEKFNSEIETCKNMIFSESIGYYFSNSKDFNFSLPCQIDHIVQHVIL